MQVRTSGAQPGKNRTRRKRLACGKVTQHHETRLDRRCQTPIAGLRMPQPLVLGAARCVHEDKVADHRGSDLLSAFVIAEQPRPQRRFSLHNPLGTIGNRFFIGGSRDFPSTRRGSPLSNVEPATFRQNNAPFNQTQAHFCDGLYELDIALRDPFCIVSRSLHALETYLSIAAAKPAIYSP